MFIEKLWFNVLYTHFCSRCRSKDWVSHLTEMLEARKPFSAEYRAAARYEDRISIRHMLRPQAATVCGVSDTATGPFLLMTTDSRVWSRKSGVHILWMSYVQRELSFS